MTTAGPASQRETVVLIVEPDPNQLKLASILVETEPGFSVLGECPTPEAALVLVESREGRDGFLHPHVLLVAWDGGSEQDRVVVRELAERFPGADLALWTSLPPDDLGTRHEAPVATATWIHKRSNRELLGYLQGVRSTGPDDDGQPTWW